ncbi:MAG: FAD-dependent oxidoreductase [Verrucomicrobiae bacterium]
MNSLTEPSRSVPIIHEADICVLGGSCTGLFAAIRAARLGARVAIVEKDNCFGGIATTALVNIWHSLWDTEGRRQIIGGLTEEVIDRLDRRGAVKRWEKTNPSNGFSFNSEELKIDLDELACEAKLKTYFHTLFVAPHLDADGRLDAVIVENKSGRGAIRAKHFIDATGDGDLAARLGCPTYFANHLQPATACARFSNWSTLGGADYVKLLRDHGAAFNLPQGFAWCVQVPGSEVYMMAATRIYGINPAEADDLTSGEIEGRRQVRAIQDIIRQHLPGSKLCLEALPSHLGLRESRHVRAAYQLSGDEILSGRRFDDAIAQGSYRVDIHHQEKPGITLRYLDGTETYDVPGEPRISGRWREPTPDSPTFYQIPYRALLPQGGFENLIVAGRMLDMDPVAHAAVRVMVNLNQVGEAAGVACVLALETDSGLPSVDPLTLRGRLETGGSASFIPRESRRSPEIPLQS